MGRRYKETQGESPLDGHQPSSRSSICSFEWGWTEALPEPYKMTQSRILANMFFTTVKIRLLGQYLSIALSSSLHLMACLLVSLPHSSKCANQEKLNLTCNLRGLQIWSNVISNDKDMGGKSKTRKFVKRNQERAMTCGCHWLAPFLRVVLLPRQCTFCHFHLYQGRWNGVTTVYTSLLHRLISRKFNCIKLWWLSFPLLVFY